MQHFCIKNVACFDTLGAKRYNLFFSTSGRKACALRRINRRNAEVRKERGDRLLIIYCSLFIVHCLLFIVYCLLFIVYCLLFFVLC